MGYDRKPCSAVLGVFPSVLCRSVRIRVKKAFGVCSVDDAKVGGLNIHAVVVVDGRDRKRLKRGLHHRFKRGLHQSARG